MTDNRCTALRCELDAVLSALSNAALWLAGIGLVADDRDASPGRCSAATCSTRPRAGPKPPSIMLMSWFIFLGAAVGVRENYHMGFDVLLYFLPRQQARWLRTISDLAILAFGVGMVWYGMQLVSAHLEHDHPGRSACPAASTICRSSRGGALMPALRAGAHRAALARAIGIDHDVECRRRACRSRSDCAKA